MPYIPRYRSDPIRIDSHSSVDIKKMTQILSCPQTEKVDIRYQNIKYPDDTAVTLQFQQPSSIHHHLQLNFIPNLENLSNSTVE